MKHIILTTILLLMTIISNSQNEISLKGEKMMMENTEFVGFEKYTNDLVFYQKVYSDKIISKDYNLYLNDLNNILSDASFTEEKQNVYYIKTQLSRGGETDNLMLVTDFDTSIEEINFESFDYETILECNNSVKLSDIDEYYDLVRIDNNVVVLNQFCDEVYKFDFDFSWKYNLYVDKNRGVILLNCNNDYLYFWDINLKD